MDLQLNGKVAIVTGGAQGLGRAICESLAAEGTNLLINYYKNEDKVEETLEILKKYNIETLAFEANVASEEDVDAMFDVAIQKFGKVDILINNAGICPMVGVLDMSLDLWNAVININLTGVFLTCKKMANLLIGSKSEGRIINIASQAAYNGSKSGKTHYAASKGGVVTFTHSLAKEISKHGINVNAIAPGLIYTDMTAEVIDKNLEKYQNDIPIGRIAKPVDVAKMVTIMASDASSYVTGTTVDLSGGMISR